MGGSFIIFVTRTGIVSSIPSESMTRTGIVTVLYATSF